MLITCPTCASSYRIKAAKIGPDGRSVRCAACRETWFLTPADALEDEDDLSLDPAITIASDPVADTAWAEAATAIRETAAGEEPNGLDPGAARTIRKRATVRRGMFLPRGARTSPMGISPAAILCLLVLAAAPVACLARAGVVSVIPRSAPLFSAIGLPVNRRGVEIHDVVAFQNPAEDERPAELVVEGDLVGVGRGADVMPGLAVSINDAAGKVVRTFTAPAPRSSLATGETARFRVSLTDPPTEGRAVLLRFADLTGPNPSLPRRK